MSVRRPLCSARVNRLFCCQQWTQRCVAVLALSSRVSCCYVTQAEPSVRILQPAWAVVVLHWCCTATQSLFFTANKTWCQSFFFSLSRWWPANARKCSAFYTAAIKHGAIPVMMSPPRIYAARLKGGKISLVMFYSAKAIVDLLCDCCEEVVGFCLCLCFLSHVFKNVVMTANTEMDLSHHAWDGWGGIVHNAADTQTGNKLLETHVTALLSLERFHFATHSPNEATNHSFNRYFHIWQFNGALVTAGFGTAFMSSSNHKRTRP